MPLSDLERDLLFAAKLGLENMETELYCTLESLCERSDDTFEPIISTLPDADHFYVRELGGKIALIKTIIEKAEKRP